MIYVDRNALLVAVLKRRNSGQTFGCVFYPNAVTIPLVLVLQNHCKVHVRTFTMRA